MTDYKAVQDEELEALRAIFEVSHDTRLTGMDPTGIPSLRACGLFVTELAGPSQTYKSGHARRCGMTSNPAKCKSDGDAFRSRASESALLIRSTASACLRSLHECCKCTELSSNRSRTAFLARGNLPHGRSGRTSSVSDPARRSVPCDTSSL